MTAVTLVNYSSNLFLEKFIIFFSSCSEQLELPSEAQSTDEFMKLFDNLNNNIIVNIDLFQALS